MHIHAPALLRRHPRRRQSGPRDRARSSPDARQGFARERNTTCAWIDPPQQGGSAASVDFYYPHTRSPLSLHATLAAAERLFMRAGAQPSLTVTAAGLRRSGTDLCHGLSLLG